MMTKGVIIIALQNIGGFKMGFIPVAAAVFQGVQAVRGYQAEKQAAKATKAANAAAMSAATEEARLLREDAGINAQKERELAARARSSQIALFLKSGVTLDGSPLLVTNETKNKGDENASNIMANAESQSKSMMLRAQANQQPVKRADLFGTAASVLGSAQTASTAYKKAGY
jgi:hypothetical protein